MTEQEARAQLNAALDKRSEFTAPFTTQRLQHDRVIRETELAIQAGRSALRAALQLDDLPAIETAERAIQEAETVLRRATLKKEMLDSWQDDPDNKRRYAELSADISAAWSVLWQSHRDEYAELEKRAQEAKEAYLVACQDLFAGFRKVVEHCHERGHTPPDRPHRPRQIDFEIEWDALLKRSGGIHCTYP